MAEPQAVIYLRVPYDLKQKLEDLSRETGETQTAIIINAIKYFIENTKK